MAYTYTGREDTGRHSPESSPYTLADCPPPIDTVRSLIGQTCSNSVHETGLFPNPIVRKIPEITKTTMQAWRKEMCCWIYYILQWYTPLFKSDWNPEEEKMAHICNLADFRESIHTLPIGTQLQTTRLMKGIKLVCTIYPNPPSLHIHNTMASTSETCYWHGLVHRHRSGTPCSWPQPVSGVRKVRYSSAWWRFCELWQLYSWSVPSVSDVPRGLRRVSLTSRPLRWVLLKRFNSSAEMLGAP